MSNLYAFQGQESDDEIKGDGNSVNYKYRMHDPRLGRFFAVDPLAADYPHNSPYAFSENEVIQFVELEGLEKAIQPIFRTENGITKCVNQGQIGKEDLPVNRKPKPATVSYPANYPSMTGTTGVQIERRSAALNQKITMDKLEHSPLNDFVKIGQGLTYAPEAASIVLLPEIAGTKISNIVFKAGSFASRTNLAGRTMNVGMNYLSQSISDNGNLDFSSKDQIGLATSFFLPTKFSYSKSLVSGGLSSQFSFSYKDGFSSPLLEGNFGLAGMKALGSGLGTMLSQSYNQGGLTRLTFLNKTMGAFGEGAVNSMFKDFGKPKE